MESRPHNVHETSQMSFPLKINNNLFSSRAQGNKEWLNQKQYNFERSQETITHLNNSSAQKRLNGAREKFSDLMNQITALRQKIDEENQEGKELPRLVKAQMVTAANVHKNKKKEIHGNMVFIGDTNWNLVLNMMIGIQMAVRSVKGYQQMIYE